MLRKKVKVKGSCKRPGVAQKIPGDPVTGPVWLRRFQEIP
jgi:hypothetical protein